MLMVQPNEFPMTSIHPKLDIFIADTIYLNCFITALSAEQAQLLELCKMIGENSSFDFVLS